MVVRRVAVIVGLGYLAGWVLLDLLLWDGSELDFFDWLALGIFIALLMIVIASVIPDLGPHPRPRPRERLQPKQDARDGEVDHQARPVDERRDERR